MSESIDPLGYSTLITIHKRTSSLAGLFVRHFYAILNILLLDHFPLCFASFNNHPFTYFLLLYQVNLI